MMLRLSNALLTDGRTVDVTIDGGHIATVEETGSGPGSGIDLEGRLLLPAMVEPHAHLDKAFTADRFPNRGGDLAGAMEAIHAGWPSITVDDIFERAWRAMRRLVASGTTTVRSHADLIPETELRSIEALLAVRRELADLGTLEVVAMVMPLVGPEGPGGRRALTMAIEKGVDVVGGCPHLEEDPAGSIRVSLDAARTAGLPIDLHFDEVLDPAIQHLELLAREVIARGMEGRVVASHCVSHGLLSPQRQAEVARALADAGVAVVVNPRSNLFLQGRDVVQATPRGLAGVRSLLDGGVTVAAGADNIQDPFYFLGRSDALETGSLAVAVAHVSVGEAWSLITDGARRALGKEEVAIVPGAPADLMAIAAINLREAMADQTADRIVFHRGRLVARTTVEGWMA